MQRRFKELLMLWIACLVLSQINYGQQDIKFQEVKFRQVVRLVAGSQEGQVFVKVQPNKLAVVPRLLPPDADGNFWIVGEAKGGIMRVNRLGEVVAILRQRSLDWPSVNSSGHLATYVRKGEAAEVAIYSPTGRKVGVFMVNGCPRCGHASLRGMTGLDDKNSVWLTFSSSGRSMEEDPKQTVCVVAFDLGGRVVQHIEGTWGLLGGKLFRRARFTNGSYRSFLILEPQSMKTSEIPVPAGWDGFPLGIDLQGRIWCRAWRLNNIKAMALLAFGKEGIAAVLPTPNKFLGGEPSKEIFSSEVIIGTDGRLYVAQCTKEAFYIFEADMSFLKQ